MAASPTQPFYDRERTSRRPAPDWGGDDLFDAVPRRRFTRAPLPEPPGATAPVGTGHPDEQPVVGPEALSAPSAPPARRTVVITGQPGRSTAVERHRPSRLEQRIHARPDRLAAWAFALCVFLIIVALATSF